MKTIHHFPWLQFCSAAVIYLLAGTSGARAWESYEAEGLATNGIYASVSYRPDYPGGGHAISTFIHFKPPSTNIDYISAFEVGKYQAAKYFSTPNSFIGFIELNNTNGDKIPVLKPWVNSPDAYPSSYSLKQARVDLNKGTSMGPELPGAITGIDPEAGNFYMKDFFLIEKPGDYQLTVWPKIYRRSEANNDLMKRIDLPPVTIPIHWTEPHHDLQMSIRLKNSEDIITTNRAVELLFRYRNASSNETFYITVVPQIFWLRGKKELACRV